LRPRVLFWYWGRRGGGARFAYEAIVASKDLDCLDSYVSLSRQNEWLTPTQSLGLPAYNVDTYVDFKTALRRLPAVPAMANRFKRYLREHEIAAVVSLMRGPLTTPMLPAIERSGAKLISIVHDAHPHRGEIAPLFAQMQRLEVLRSSIVLVLNPHVQKQLQEMRIIPDSRIRLTTHGAFNAQSPTPSRIRTAKDTLRLLFVGRIEPYKNLPMLIEAVERVQETFEVHLTIAGAGRIDVSAEKLSRLRGVTVDNRWLSEQDIDDHLAAADVCILPYSEASHAGVVNLAFGAGRPVIATPVGGLVDQIRHGQNGLLAADLSSTAMANAIALIAVDPGLQLRLSEGAAATARDEPGWASLANDICDAVHSALGSGSNATASLRRKPSSTNSS